MNVLILGATGRVGQHLVRQGLDRGHRITALVRRPEKLSRVANRQRVLQGDVLDPQAVEAAVTGQDAVVYSIGVRRPGRTTLFSDSTRLLLDAMIRHAVRRLVCITGVGAGETKGHGGWLYDRLLYPLFTRHVYEDKDRQEALIRSSQIEWTIVRPAVFRKGAARTELQAVTDLRTVTLRRIAPAEVATFALDQLTDNRFLRQAPFIGHPR